MAVRMVSMRAPRPAIGRPSAAAVAGAALVPGSVVGRLCGAERSGLLRLGTRAGVVTVRLQVDAAGRLRSVSMSRAARRIAVAEVFVPLAGSADVTGPVGHISAGSGT